MMQFIHFFALSFKRDSVDWSIGAGTLDYRVARYRVSAVAEVTVKFINFLLNNKYSKTSQIIIVGHSLGAHIAGLTGRKLKGHLYAIIALDPAGPLFLKENSKDTFKRDDAQYTQAIHTNAGVLGYRSPLAHADFYPNW